MIDYRKLTYAQAIEQHEEALQRCPHGLRDGQMDDIIKTRATTPRGIANALNRFYGEKIYTAQDVVEMVHDGLEIVESRPRYIVKKAL